MEAIQTRLILQRRFLEDKMTQIIIFKNLDGSCGIVYPAKNVNVEYLDEIEFEELYEEIELVDGKRVALKKMRTSKRMDFVRSPACIEDIIMHSVPGLRMLINKAKAVIDQVEVEIEAEKPSEAYYRIGEDNLQKITPFRVTTTEKIPKDKYFRKAWTDDNPTETVDICMEKARDIHMNNIRNARNEQFVNMGFPTKLNPELESTIISQETRDKLQFLRDIPQNTDLSLATTPEELKQIWPLEAMEVS